MTGEERVPIRDDSSLGRIRLLWHEDGQSATSTIALVALGATASILAVACSGAAVGAPSAAATAARFPVCAANLSAYPPVKAGTAGVHPSGTDGLLMPGSPVAAVLCRYGGSGKPGPAGTLARSVTVTDPARLARLQNAMNASRALPAGTAMYCMQADGNAAVVLIVYPHSTDRRVRYETWCGTLTSDSATYLPGGSIVQLITNWTGQWQPTTEPSAN